MVTKLSIARETQSTSVPLAPTRERGAVKNPGTALRVRGAPICKRIYHTSGLHFLKDDGRDFVAKRGRPPAVSYLLLL